jgi:hypothetical protein
VNVMLEFLVMSWISNSIERCQSQSYQYVPCEPISNFIKHVCAQDIFAMNDMEYLWCRLRQMCNEAANLVTFNSSSLGKVS